MISQPALTSGRVRAARGIAIAADFLQIVVFPVFAPGAASAVNDALDVAVAVLMYALVGWHWAFLPTFFAELVPIFDLVPTWTAAVFFATRRSQSLDSRARAPNGKGTVINTEVVSSSPGSKAESGGRSVM